nr:hypothetical protein HK105_005669 [Polyrhizophydium stewartii]
MFEHIIIVKPPLALGDRIDDCVGRLAVELGRRVVDNYFREDFEDPANVIVIHILEGIVEQIDHSIVVKQLSPVLEHKVENIELTLQNGACDALVVVVVVIIVIIVIIIITLLFIFLGPFDVAVSI